MEKKNDNKIVIVIMSIVILVLVGAIVYMFTSGTKYNNHNNNKENNNVQQENNNNAEPEIIDIAQYQMIYNFVQSTTLPFTKDGLTMKEVFWSKGWTNKDLSDDIKLAMYIEINGTTKFQYARTEEIMGQSVVVYKLNANEVLNGINEIFGVSNGYSHTSVGPVDGCKNLKYNSNKEVYELYDQSGCGDIQLYAAHNKIVKTVKTMDSIVVTEKVYFSNSEGKVYKDLQFTQKIDDVYDENKSDYYYENAATVTYTFKLEQNGNYYFDNSKINY